jgi:hypothetical protein
MIARSSPILTGRRALAAAVVVAIVARVVAAIALGDGFHFADETDYVDCVRRLLAGQGFGVRYQQGPGYPVFLGLLALPLSAKVLWLRIGQAVVTGAGCALLAWLAIPAFGTGTAVVACWLYALDPLMVVAGALLYPEAAATLLFLIVALLADRGARYARVGLSLAAGVVLGVLGQLRPVALAVLPFLGAWVAVVLGGSAAKRASHVGALVLGCVLALTPWTVRNYRVHGAFTPLQTAGTQVVAAPSTGREHRGLTASILATATEEPGRFIKRVTREFGYFWELYPTRLASDQPAQRARMNALDPRMPTGQAFEPSIRNAVSVLSFGAELLLALIGIVLAWRRDRRTTLLLIGTILSFAFGYTLFVAKMRYRIPVVPFLYVFSGVGAMAVFDAVRVRMADRSTAR